jgi:hypothetical protein
MGISDGFLLFFNQIRGVKMIQRRLLVAVLAVSMPFFGVGTAVACADKAGHVKAGHVHVEQTKVTKKAVVKTKKSEPTCAQKSAATSCDMPKK